MNKTEALLLDALRCGIRGESVSWDAPLSPDAQRELTRLAHAHSVLPLVAEAGCAADCAPVMYSLARRLTIRQAQRTGDFLLLYRQLTDRGLQPLIIKGIVLRELYPHPEQRPSVDEDLLVSDADWPRLRDALLDCGLQIEGEPTPDADEVTFRDRQRHLYIEVHRRLFSPDSTAYGDCNIPFSGAQERSVTVQIEGTVLRTRAPTDHLLYLICHAYKHFLHSGVGIRQVCDMGLFAEHYASQLDWEHIADSCRELHIASFAAALFRVGAVHLGFSVPAVFADYDGDIDPLLADILSGGMYGAEDIDRLHSSTLTLEAVSADRTGRRRGGALHSVFLPAKDLSGRYPYLRRRPWLLPVAWTQRIWGYLTRRKYGPVSPAESLRIGRDRIALLRQYGIIDS